METTTDATLASSLTPRRQELVDWFARNAPPLSEAYEAAVQLIGSPTFPARLHLISHLVRDIANRLPDILEGTTSTRVDYVNLLDNIAPLWQEAFHPKAEYGEVGAEPPALPRLLPPGLSRKVDELVTLHQRSRKRLKPQERLFRSDVSRDVNSPDVLRPMEKQFMEICSWFQSRAHLPGKPTDAPSEEQLIQHFENFERTLLGIKGQFFTNIGELDDILQDTNS